MSQSMDIEDAVIDDVKTLLDACGLATHIENEDLGRNPDYSAGRVSIGADIAGPSLMGGQLAAGFPRVTLTLTCETHKPIDAKGQMLRALVSTVRQVVETCEFANNLTNASTRCTYYTWQLGSTFRDDMNRMANRVMTYTLILRPSQP